MLCYATGAFSTAQFAKVGVTLTLVGLGLIILFSATIWPMMGLV
jgi:di/tricarboxylate transporter